MEKKDKELEKRLSIDIPESMHYELRKIALKYRISVKKCMVQILEQLIEQEKSYD